MAKLAQRQKRKFARAYLRTLAPEEAARQAGTDQGAELLEQEDVLEEIRRQKALWLRTLDPTDVARRAAELAFGRSNDCVKLALQEDLDLDGLDLSLLAEIKRSEKGAVEIKMVDRMKALEYLEQLLGKAGGEEQRDKVLEFLKDMDRFCEEAGQ